LSPELQLLRIGGGPAPRVFHHPSTTPFVRRESRASRRNAGAGLSRHARSDASRTPTALPCRRGAPACSRAIYLLDVTQEGSSARSCRDPVAIGDVDEDRDRLCGAATGAQRRGPTPRAAALGGARTRRCERLDAQMGGEHSRPMRARGGDPSPTTRLGDRDSPKTRADDGRHDPRRRRGGGLGSCPKRSTVLATHARIPPDRGENWPKLLAERAPSSGRRRDAMIGARRRDFPTPPTDRDRRRLDRSRPATPS